MNSKLRGFFLVVALVVGPVRGQDFTLDEARSVVVLSGTVAGSGIQEQAAGSLTTRFGGVFKVSRTPGNLVLLPGSTVSATVNGNWQPGVGGGAGSAPANYGGKADAFIASATAALRNVQLEVTSGTLTLSAGAFDSSALVFSFPAAAAAALDYKVSGLVSMSGSKALSGLAANKVTTQGSLKTLADGSEELTVPVAAELVLKLVSANDTLIRLTGQLVAVRKGGTTVPALFSGVTVVSNQVTLRWSGPAGASFRVEASDDLRTWLEQAGGATTEASGYSWRAAAPGGLRFYRLRY